MVSGGPKAMAHVVVVHGHSVRMGFNSPYATVKSAGAMAGAG
jgi:hypothetical protein